MSGLVEFSDGRFGLVRGDGWIDEFDVVEPSSNLDEGARAIGGAFIDVEPVTVVDTEANA